MYPAATHRHAGGSQGKAGRRIRIIAETVGAGCGLRLQIAELAV